MTILYADISGFTNYSKTHGAQAVVRLVTMLFSTIDDLSRKVGVYKVCTIGDCYVATLEPDAIDISEDDRYKNRILGCSDMFQFASGLVYVVSVIREKLKVQLGMRVGLHLGKVVGGIIGQRKLRYDIWGIDVLITNKMEEFGEPDHINVSEVLKEFTATHFPNRFAWRMGKYVEEYDMQSYLMTHDRGLRW